MAKILITGAAGFIGSNLCDFFSNYGYEVIGLDLKAPDSVKNMVFYAIDLLATSIESLIKIHKPDICIHCAGPASVPNSLNFLENDFKLTVLPTFNVLNGIKNFAPECKFLYLSSAAVYGNPAHLPIKEDDAAKPISPYGFHKLNAESVCNEFFSLYHLQIAVIRIFSVFGIGLKKQLLWDICNKAKNSRVIELFGTGDETRDFIHITDLLEAIRLIIEKGPFNLDIFNIANGYQIKVKEVASTLVSAFPLVSEVRFNGENRPGDPINWEADITKINQLGYKQKASFKEGVLEYAEWFKKL